MLYSYWKVYADLMKFVNGQIGPGYRIIIFLTGC